MAVALAEAEAVASRADLTAAVVLDGLAVGGLAPDPDSAEWRALDTCLQERGSLRGFRALFGVGPAAAAAVAAAFPPPPSVLAPPPAAAAVTAATAGQRRAALGAVSDDEAEVQVVEAVEAEQRYAAAAASEPDDQGRRGAGSRDDGGVVSAVGWWLGGAVRRALQQTAASTASTAPTATTAANGKLYNGYRLFGNNLMRLEYSLSDLVHTPVPTRTLGSSGSAVIAGLFLYQTRLPTASQMDAYGGCSWAKGRFSGRLAAACAPGYSRTLTSNLAAAAAAANGSTNSSGSSGSSTRGGGGIGIDPVFVRRSQLYRSDLASDPGAYYNASEGAGQLNPNGVPYGFVPSPVPLPGFDRGDEELRRRGYPLLLDAGMSQRRAQEALLALGEGSYLDPALTERWAAREGRGGGESWGVGWSGLEWVGVGRGRRAPHVCCAEGGEGGGGARALLLCCSDRVRGPAPLSKTPCQTRLNAPLPRPRSLVLLPPPTLAA